MIHINFRGDYTDEIKAPYIDNMSIDESTGSSVLFGTSKSREVNSSGDEIHLWKVTLDSSGNPLLGTFACFQVKAGNINNEGFANGMSPVLHGGNMHFIWSKDDQDLFYAIMPFAAGVYKSDEVHEN